MNKSPGSLADIYLLHMTINTIVCAISQRIYYRKLAVPQVTIPYDSGEQISQIFMFEILSPKIGHIGEGLPKNAGVAASIALRLNQRFKHVYLEVFICSHDVRKQKTRDTTSPERDNIAGEAQHCRQNTTLPV